METPRPGNGSSGRLRNARLLLAAVCLVPSACGAPQSASQPAPTNAVSEAASASPSSAAAPSAAPSRTALASTGPSPGFVALEGTGDLARYAGSVYASEVDELAINLVLFLQPEGPAFSPTVINVARGQQLKLTFHDLDAHDDDGIAAHDFTIEALDLSVTIPKGGDATIELTMPSERTTLQFICRPHLRDYKMAGEIRVN